MRCLKQSSRPPCSDIHYTLFVVLVNFAWSKQELQCIAWRDLVATAQQGNRRSLSITSLLKSDRRAFDVTSLLDVRAGNEEVCNSVHYIAIY